MKTRIIAMLLVLVMLIMTLASCGGKDTPDETKAPASTTSGGTDLSKWDEVNFQGNSITVSLNDYEFAYVRSAGSTNSIKYVKGPDNYTTDAVQNAVFDRNKKAADMLGLNVYYQECDRYNANADNTLSVIESFVLSDLEDSPDIVSTMSYGVVRAGIKGLLYNALLTDKENYFDLTANGWYTDFMYENTLDESKIFLLAGDYFIDILRYAYGIMVNLDMYDEVFASEGGSESLFDLVEAGEWDYDELKRSIEMAFVDAGSIGQYDDADIFGAVNHDSWIVRTTFSTSGLDIFENDENGNVRYITDITDVHNYVDDMIDLVTTEGFYLDSAKGTNYEHTDVFVEGRALFALDAPVLNMEGTLIQNMDDKVGIIPYPKYKEDGKYGALVSDNGNVGGILYNSEKFTECSAYLQMMAETSNTGKGSLIYEYFDIALKYKLSATPKQVSMLELIRAGVCSPKSILYDGYFAKSKGLTSYRKLIDISLASGVNTFSSDWNSQIGAISKALEETLLTYGQQN